MCFDAINSQLYLLLIIYLPILQIIPVGDNDNKETTVLLSKEQQEFINKK